MIEISKNLFVGNDQDCIIARNYAIIHACKTCHQKALNYRKSLPSNHPYYLVYEDGINLYLNMVDMENELLAKFTNPIMKAAIEFINKNIQNSPILIHCNQGQSRSPSIGLLYMAIEGMIKNISYSEAVNEFRQSFGNYFPGRGIELYLTNNWNSLVGIL